MPRTIGRYVAGVLCVLVCGALFGGCGYGEEYDYAPCGDWPYGPLTPGGAVTFWIDDDADELLALRFEDSAGRTYECRAFRNAPGGVLIRFPEGFYMVRGVWREVIEYRPPSFHEFDDEDDDEEEPDEWTSKRQYFTVTDGITFPFRISSSGGNRDWFSTHAPDAYHARW